MQQIARDLYYDISGEEYFRYWLASHSSRPIKGTRSFITVFMRTHCSESGEFSGHSIPLRLTRSSTSCNQCPGYRADNVLKAFTTNVEQLFLNLSMCTTLLSNVSSSLWEILLRLTKSTIRKFLLIGFLPPSCYIPFTPNILRSKTPSLYVTVP